MYTISISPSRNALGSVRLICCPEFQWRYASNRWTVNFIPFFNVDHTNHVILAGIYTLNCPQFPISCYVGSVRMPFGTKTMVVKYSCIQRCHVWQILHTSLSFLWVKQSIFHTSGVTSPPIFPMIKLGVKTGSSFRGFSLTRVIGRELIQLSAAIIVISNSSLLTSAFSKIALIARLVPGIMWLNIAPKWIPMPIESFFFIDLIQKFLEFVFPTN